MKKLLTLLAMGLTLSLGAAHAADDKAPTKQQNKMGACNKEADGKKGDERKAFMKECLSAKPAPESAACEKSATDKKLAGAAKSSHIKKCMADEQTGAKPEAAASKPVAAKPEAAAKPAAAASAAKK